MNPDSVSNLEITTGAAGLNPALCNFMYGQQPGAWNVCERDKGHYGHHHDSRTGVSWTNTFTMLLPTTTAAIAPGHHVALPG